MLRDEFEGGSMSNEGTSEWYQAWNRIRSASKFAFERIDDVGDLAPRPQAVDDWLNDAIHGMGLGMLVGSLRAALQEVQRPADILQVLQLDGKEIVNSSSGDGSVDRRRFMRSLQRFARVGTATVRGGLLLGSLSASYSGCRAIASVARDEKDAINDALAASVLGGALGAFAGTGMGAKFAGSVGGVIAGGALGYPIGRLRSHLEVLALQDQYNSGDVLLGQEQGSLNAIEEGAQNADRRDAVWETIVGMEAELQSQRGSVKHMQEETSNHGKKWWYLWKR